MGVSGRQSCSAVSADDNNLATATLDSPAASVPLAVVSCAINHSARLFSVLVTLTYPIRLLCSLPLPFVSNHRLQAYNIRPLSLYTVGGPTKTAAAAASLLMFYDVTRRVLGEENCTRLSLQ